MKGQKRHLENCGVFHCTSFQKEILRESPSEPAPCVWRARGDLNPGSPAPQASVLIQTRLRALSTGLRPKNIELAINVLLKLKASGLQEGTLRNIAYCLARIEKNADLTNPEEVKLFIANLKVADSYKANIVKAYNYFAVLNEIKWQRPRYKYESKIPKIPTRENIMKIISHAKKYAPIFKVLMETGLMPKELENVQLKDIDFEQRTLRARGLK